MNPVLSMAIKDIRVLFRDKLGAFFIIGFPICMGLFFGLIMNPRHRVDLEKLPSQSSIRTIPTPLVNSLHPYRKMILSNLPLKN